MYEAPTLVELGSLAELTQATINKTGSSGDVLVIDGLSIPVPGSALAP